MENVVDVEHQEGSEATVSSMGEFLPLRKKRSTYVSTLKTGIRRQHLSLSTGREVISI